MEFIERNPEKCFSMPSLIGRRLTVYDVVTIIAGIGFQSTIADYKITVQQAIAALQYCTQLDCKIRAEEFQFCDGCILREIADGDAFDKGEYYEIIHCRRPSGAAVWHLLYS